MARIPPPVEFIQARNVARAAMDLLDTVDFDLMGPAFEVSMTNAYNELSDALVASRWIDEAINEARNTPPPG